MVSSETARDQFMRVLFWVGLATAGIGMVGEVLGWWGEFGLVLTVGGLLAGIASTLDVNGRRILVIARVLPERLGALDRGQGLLLANQDAMLASQDTLLGKQDALLGKQDALIGKQDESLSELRRIGDLLEARL